MESWSSPPVAAHVQVRVIGAPIGEAVDQPGVAVVGEEDGSVGREERVELAVREAVGVLALGLEAHQVDDVDDAHLQLRQPFAQDRGRRQRLECRYVATAGEDNVGLLVTVVGGPLPDPDSPRAVEDRLLHGQELERGLLACHDDVHVLFFSQGFGGHREQAVRIGGR
jgi:hypothetical protein